MPIESVTLKFDDNSSTEVDVDVEEQAVGGASTSLRVADMGASSPLRKAAEKTLRPSGAVGVVISARSQRIANAVVAALATAASQHKPSIRIAPNLPPV